MKSAKQKRICHLFDINHGIVLHTMLGVGVIKLGDVVLRTDIRMNVLDVVGTFAIGGVIRMWERPISTVSVSSGFQRP